MESEVMRLTDAIDEVAERIVKCEKVLKDTCPEYVEALKIAVKSMEAQLVLFDMINDIAQDNEDDTYTKGLLLDILNSLGYHQTDGCDGGDNVDE